MPTDRVSRLRICLGCLCAIFALVPAALCTPAAVAVSAAGGSAFSELTEGGKETSAGTTPKTATTTPTTPKEATASTATSNSNASSVLLLGLIAAMALIGGIGFMILRDAHRVAPVPDGQVTAQGRPAQDVATMMRKRRAKAKAARAQRKRNR